MSDEPIVTPRAGPPEEKGFGIDEVDSIYVDDRERYVVALIVGYEGDEVRSARHAAAAALELTRDAGSDGTVWHVFDRETGQMVSMEQSEFALEEGDSLDAYEEPEDRPDDPSLEDVASDEALALDAESRELD